MRGCEGFPSALSQAARFQGFLRDSVVPSQAALPMLGLSGGAAVRLRTSLGSLWPVLRAECLSWKSGDYRDDFLDTTLREIASTVMFALAMLFPTPASGCTDSRCATGWSDTSGQCGKPGACRSEPGCVHAHWRHRLPESVHVPRHPAELHRDRDLAMRPTSASPRTRAKAA